MSTDRTKQFTFLKLNNISGLIQNNPNYHVSCMTNAVRLCVNNGMDVAFLETAFSIYEHMRVYYNSSSRMLKVSISTSPSEDGYLTLGISVVGNDIVPSRILCVHKSACIKDLFNVSLVAEFGVESRLLYYFSNPGLKSKNEVIKQAGSVTSQNPESKERMKIFYARTKEGLKDDSALQGDRTLTTLFARIIKHFFEVGKSVLENARVFIEKSDAQDGGTTCSIRFFDLVGTVFLDLLRDSIKGFPETVEIKVGLHNNSLIVEYTQCSDKKLSVEGQSSDKRSVSKKRSNDDDAWAYRKKVK